MTPTDSASGQGAASTKLSRLGPVGIAVAVALCSLLVTGLLWRALEAREVDALAKLLDSHAISARAQIEDGIRTRAQALQRMAQRWDVRDGTPEHEWRADATHYLAMSGVLHTDRVDESGRVVWVEPEKAFEAVVGRNLMSDPQRAAVVREARRIDDVTASPTLTLANGRAGFFLLTPVRTRGRPDGFLRMVLDSEALLNDLLKETVAQGLVVVVDDGTARIVGDRASLYTATPSIERNVSINGIRWRLQLLPTWQLASQAKTLMPRATLIGGGAMSVLLGFTVALYLVAHRRRAALLVREKTLQDSERKYRSLLDAMSDGVFVARDARFVYVNPALPPLLACSEATMLGRELTCCFDEALPLSSARLRPGLAALPVPIEVQVRRHDNVRRWMELTLQPTTYEDRPAVLGILRDIDDRKTAEVRAREARERTELVAGGLVDGVWDINLVTGEHFQSERTWALMGLPEGSLPPTIDAWLERVHPDDRDRVNTAARRHLNEHEPYIVDYRFLSGRGDYRWFHAVGQARWDEKGRPVRMAGSVTDITDQRTAEIALAESEARFRAAMDYSAIGMALVSLTGAWLRVNHSLCEMLGYTEAEFFALTFQDITHPDDLETDLALLHSLVAGKIPSYKLDKRYVRKDGRAVWARLAVALTRKNDGTPDYFISQIEDIDLQRRAEQARVASEARFRAVAESATDAIVTIDQDGIVVFANAAVQRVFGHAPDQLTGQSIDRLFPGADADARDVHLADVVRDLRLKNAGGTVEVMGLRAGGDSFPLELSAAIWLVGDVRYITTIMRDVTDRHAQQQKMIDAVQERETLLKEVYHRVKNNLQVIQSLLSLQSRVLPESDRIARDAFEDTITRVRAMALVHEKLYQSGSLAVVGARDYIDDLLNHIAQSSASEQRRIRILADVDDQPLTLDTAIPLGLLLNELVGNSLKHAFPDNRQGVIRVSLKREQDRARVTVSDDGIGFGGSAGPASSMGTRLADALTKQLGGRLEWQAADGGGTVATALIECGAGK